PNSRPASQAMDPAYTRAARMVRELELSGAFHSSLMRPAAEGLAVAIEHANLQDAAVPIVANATAAPIASTEQIADELIRQLTTAVQWQRSIELMSRLGVTTYVEIGHGKV